MEKSAKTRFLYLREYRHQKMKGKRTREIIFPETHQQCEHKMLGKKSSQKSAKKLFFNSQEYRDQKIGCVNARSNLSRNSTKRADKKCWEKNRRKKLRKNVFYIHTNIVSKKWRKKTRETIFPETQLQSELKMLGNKSSHKSAKRRFLYSYEYRDQKMGGKKRETIFPETLE